MLCLSKCIYVETIQNVETLSKVKTFKIVGTIKIVETKQIVETSQTCENGYLQYKILFYGIQHKPCTRE